MLFWSGYFSILPINLLRSVAYSYLPVINITALIETNYSQHSMEKKSAYKMSANEVPVMCITLLVLTK